MTVTVLRYILLCLFIVSIVQAETPVYRTPWRPPTSVLPPKELAPLLERWDQAMKSDKFRDKSRVLGQVTSFVPKGRRFANRYFLCYSNPEIIDRVINHYLEEAAKAGQPIAADATGEGSAEYMITLASIAESTFDPRIYETVLMDLSGGVGDFRLLYLATVNPEGTLELLFESRPGPHGRIQRGANAGKEGHPDYFYHPEIGGISVVDAHDILSLMTTQSPEALRAQRTQVLSFVAKHVKHFATPRKRSYKPKPVYLRWYDYDVRNAALDVVGFLGTSTEMKLVEDIIHDAREVDLEYLRSIRKLDRYEQIWEKGLRIIKQILRRRSPSER